jgi:hypothetical protein
VRPDTRARKGPCACRTRAGDTSRLAEAVDVGAQTLAGAVLPRHHAPERQYLLPGTRAEGDAVGNGCCLQQPQRAHLLAIGTRLGQPGLAHVLDQHAAAREHLHQPLDHGLQQCVRFFVGGRTGLNEAGRAVGVAAVHAVQHQAMQMDVQVGCRAKALDERDRAALAFFALEPRVVQQMPLDQALHHLQHRRDQLQDAAFEEVVELALQAAPGQRPGSSPGTNSPPDCLCPGSALMNRGNSAPVLASV